MIFVDSNIPMYVAGRDHPLRDPARRFMERAAAGAIDICTSTEVLQEILYRYSALNLTHLFKDAPHLELRHHHGTLDPNKARHWLRFCLRLVDHAIQRSCQAAPAPLPGWSVAAVPPTASPTPLPSSHLRPHTRAPPALG